MTTAVIEALATGLPVITTDHSGFREQVIDGKNGFIVPEGDYRALAEKILYYLENPELWVKFGSFGREYIYNKYDSKKIIDQQIQLYESILKNT